MCSWHVTDRTTVCMRLTSRPWRRARVFLGPTGVRARTCASPQRGRAFTRSARCPAGRRRPRPRVVETVPVCRSVLVYYHRSVVGHEALWAQLATLSEQATTTAMPPAREVELPCCYGGELGLDLEAAARRLELSMDELVRLHAGAEYLVYFIGF